MKREAVERRYDGNERWEMWADMILIGEVFSWRSLCARVLNKVFSRIIQRFVWDLKLMPVYYLPVQQILALVGY